jgi:undecaprenyl diphosphate synthase
MKRDGVTITFVLGTQSMENEMIPRHVAIIPDGSRRWAKERGMTSQQGHAITFLETLPMLFSELRNAGVHTTTFWAFSTENWKRTKGEIDSLMNIYADFCGLMKSHGLDAEVQIRHIGRSDRVPMFLREALGKAEEATAHFEKGVVNIALDYGGQEDIEQASRQLCSVSAVEGNVPSIEQFLSTAGQKFPNPDLVIRTSGEKRLSGFMSWQTAYSELYFLDHHIPDVQPSDVAHAISWYGRRKRRMGA